MKKQIFESHYKYFEKFLIEFKKKHEIIIKSYYRIKQGKNLWILII